VNTTTRVCGCAGCREPATTTILHSQHGVRVVCDAHANGFEVISNV